jgi:mannose/cellobiose epimerase-like protein (N-acyl-D-glucosamine 2-epimerase family)
MGGVILSGIKLKLGLVLLGMLSALKLEAREIPFFHLLNDGWESHRNDSRLNWTNSSLWRKSAQHSNGFYIRYSWDDELGSFGSEVEMDGSRISNTRYLIASSQLLYGLAFGGNWNQQTKEAEMARRQARFVLQKMIITGDQGPYFKVAVDQNGYDLNKQISLSCSEQAEGFFGLVALYSKTRSPELLRQIDVLFDSFYRRLHDDQKLGFFDDFDLMTGRPLFPGREVSSKSYGSTVTVATSFLIDLAKLNTPRQRRYVALMEELLDIVTDHFIDSETGWIFENFTSDWKPAWRDWQVQKVRAKDGGDRTRDVSVGRTGHNYEAAWLLMRGATELKYISAEKKTKYLSAARVILVSMLKSNSLDRERGGVFDTFIRETDSPMWHQNKVWWQQTKAMLALAKAISIGLFSEAGSEEISSVASIQLDKIVSFYFDHFVDYKNGGEFSILSREGVPVVGEPKGQREKASGHSVELSRFMSEYSKAVKAQYPTLSRN